MSAAPRSPAEPDAQQPDAAPDEQAPPAAAAAPAAPARQAAPAAEPAHPTNPSPRELAHTLMRALHEPGCGPLADLIDRLRTPAFTFKDVTGERRPPTPISPADIPQSVRDACFDGRLATTLDPIVQFGDHALAAITARNGRWGAVIKLNFRLSRDDPHDPASARWRLDFFESS